MEYTKPNANGLTLCESIVPLAIGGAHPAFAWLADFYEHLVRLHVVTEDALEAAYREAAQDRAAELEAYAWIEASVGKARD